MLLQEQGVFQGAQDKAEALLGAVLHSAQTPGLILWPKYFSLVLTAVLRVFQVMSEAKIV